MVEITRPATTLMVAEPLAIPATLELAVICAVPTATPVTGTVAVLWPCGIVTVGGTVAKFVASEVSVTTMPFAGAVPGERVNIRFAEPPIPTVTVCGGEGNQTCSSLEETRWDVQGAPPLFPEPAGWKS